MGCFGAKSGPVFLPYSGKKGLIRAAADKAFAFFASLSGVPGFRSFAVACSFGRKCGILRVKKTRGAPLPPRRAATGGGGGGLPRRAQGTTNQRVSAVAVPTPFVA